jgi:RNA polymerase subunit RPABC4/transcription elongation factor Spt4
VIWFAIALICAILCGAVAPSRNRSAGNWAVGGFLLGPIGVILLFLLPRGGEDTPGGQLRKCPHCAEMIKREARVCRYCQRDVEPIEPEARTVAERRDPSVMLHCPGCNRQVSSAYDVCPMCQTTLPRIGTNRPARDVKCTGCGKTVSTAWGICPKCKTLLPAA